jgi:hypothetical protein
MRASVGKKYRTRAGARAWIISIQELNSEGARKKYPVLGSIYAEGSQQPRLCTWTIDGKAYTGHEDADDLTEVETSAD